MVNPEIKRNSMWGGILHIKQMGFAPKTVIDVGAALGTFQLYEGFPQARHVLIEPIAENEPYLAQICQTLANAEYLIAAATSQPGTATLQIAPELVHSSAAVDSVSKGASVKDERYMTRTIPAITLDQLCIERQLEPPYLVKIDVDGNEPDVIAGATETLKQTEYAVVEVSLFGQIHTVIELMKSQGFVIYDILDLDCRPGDQALWQADMAFVKAAGQFRQNTAYMPPSNQERLSRNLRAYRDSYVAHIAANYTPIDAPRFLEPFQLNSINWIAFPDWNQPEESLIPDLAKLLNLLTTHPDSTQIKLLLDSTDADAETINYAFSAAAELLSDEANLQIQTQKPVTVLPRLNMMQWQCLLPHLTARIGFTQDSRQAIAMADAQILDIQSLSE